MTPLLRHLQVCEQPFGDLDGGDLLQRRCRRCDVVVHNFDVLPRADREALLRRSDHERTVCVGSSMPVAAAPGCRASPQDDQPPVFARAIVVHDPFALTPQWWRIISLPTPAVVESIRELAGAYDLRDSSLADDLSWHVHDRAHHATIIVRVQSRGDRTEIGVRVYPLPEAHEAARFDRLHPVVALASALAGIMALLLLATFPRILLLAALLGLPLLAVVLAWLNHLDAARQPRSTEPLAAWGETWQHGFFTALEARLAPTQLYR